MYGLFLGKKVHTMRIMTFTIDYPFKKNHFLVLHRGISRIALQCESVCTAVAMGNRLKSALFSPSVMGNPSSEQVDSVS